MCSILFIRSQDTINDKSLYLSNAFAKFRGPNFTSTERFVDEFNHNFLLSHNLLDISGESIPQPYTYTDEKTELKLLFNGEIYNYERSAFIADTLSLIPLFQKYGFDDFVKHIDGEFIISIYDKKKNELYIHTDAFLTKPAYMGKKTDDPIAFGLSSYASSLTALSFDLVEMLEPNTSYKVIFNKTGFTITKHNPNYIFETIQNKNHYDDWEAAFIEAVKKRATHGTHVSFVSLSSGYDSGAICLALNILNIPYYTMSILSGESASVLNDRIEYNMKQSCIKGFTFNGVNKRKQRQMIDDLKKFAEPLQYFHEDEPGHARMLYEDSGAIGANFIGSEANKLNFKVCLSGSGADEIISDYGFNGHKMAFHSEFGGLFPDDLSTIFPWKKFYGDTQRSYLFKDEIVFGRNSIEGRYPFLDKSVVQEFLSLEVSLKNKEYKAPIAHFLKKYNYPFESNVKLGFDPMVKNKKYSLWQKIKNKIGRNKRSNR